MEIQLDLFPNAEGQPTGCLNSVTDGIVGLSDSAGIWSNHLLLVLIILSLPFTDMKSQHTWGK